MSVETPPVEKIAETPPSRMAPEADRPAATLFSRIVTILPWALLAIPGVLLAVRLTEAGARPAPVLRVGLELPAEALWEDQAGPGMALSPDGSRLVYNGGQLSESQFFVREMNQRDPLALPGTSGATQPSFSADGRWLGFILKDGVYRMPAAGGSAELVCPLTPKSLPTFTWGSDSRSVVVTELSGLRRCSMGGESTPLAQPDSTDELCWPTQLPEERGLVMSLRRGRSFELAVYDPGNQSVRPLGVTGTNPHYVSAGYLVYGTLNRELRAVRFDLKRLRVMGDPFPVVANARVGAGGAAKFAVARNGTMILSNPTGELLVILNWFDNLEGDRDGDEGGQ